jgi:hypothetical protein
MIETGRRMAEEPRLGGAARRGEVSLDQAEVIAHTTGVAPGSIDDLLSVARSESFHVLKSKARTVRLEAEDQTTLGQRQHRARRLRHWIGEMGMIHLEAALEPHIGTPMINRLQEAACRISRTRSTSDAEPFERYLADVLPTITTGSGEGSRRGRTDMVILVSHEITQRGWQDVREGEQCKIPGIGPVDPQVAREIAGNAFLNALFYDGEDLRHFKRWIRNIPHRSASPCNWASPPASMVPAAWTAATTTTSSGITSNRSAREAPPPSGTPEDAAIAATPARPPPTRRPPDNDGG